MNKTDRHCKYCTQAIIKDIGDNMGPPIVVTNDGVSFTYLGKKMNMWSSVKSHLGSGTTIALKQSSYPTSPYKTQKKIKELKNVDISLRGLRLGFKIPLPGVSNFCSIFSIQIT